MVRGSNRAGRQPRTFRMHAGHRRGHHQTRNYDCDYDSQPIGTLARVILCDPLHASLELRGGVLSVGHETSWG
eukprot:COSAG02_NODE_1266_length_13539_cov_216.818824_1_plen_72_part_10